MSERMDPSIRYDADATDRPEIRFREISVIGQDAAARYLVAFEEETGERVGIVIARPSSAASSEAAHAQALARVGAAQRAGASSLRGASRVKAVGRTAGGHPFVVSAIGGGLLLSEFDELEVSDSVELLAEAAAVLESAHAQGVVHGSVSPHTIFVTDEGAVQLHAFGIAASSLTSERAFAGAARADVRALARVGRALLADAPGGPVPRAVAALISRAESEESPMPARAFADGLARAAGASAGGVLDSDDDSVIPAASAYDSSRWSRPGWRAASVAGAVAALLVVFFLFGDAIGLAGGRDSRALDPDPSIIAEQREAAGTMAPEESSGDRDGVTRAPATDTGAEPEAAAPPPPPERPTPDERAERERPPVERARSIATPAPPPPMLEGEFATIPGGTRFSLISGERVCTSTHAPGTRFPAKVERSVTGADGAVIPAGSDAVLVVTSVNRGPDDTDAIRFGIGVVHIVVDGIGYPVEGSITSAKVEPVRASSGAADAGAVVGGIAAGALLGRVLGRDTRSTVIGAAAGAAAGTIIAMGTAERAGCIPAGGTIGIRLDAPLRMPVG